MALMAEDGAHKDHKFHVPTAGEAVKSVRKSKLWGALTHGTNFDIHEIAETDAKVGPGTAGGQAVRGLLPCHCAGTACAGCV